MVGHNQGRARTTSIHESLQPVNSQPFWVQSQSPNETFLVNTNKQMAVSPASSNSLEYEHVKSFSQDAKHVA
jgi:hypothetical protein